MSKKIIDNWVQLAEYDILTAKAMLDARRYLYVAFTCQQAVEKLLKAIYVKEKGTTPPYTHNLIKLLTELSFQPQVDSDTSGFLELLNSYYIESRYTETLREVAKLLNKKKADMIYSKTEKAFQWLKIKI
jgi:HEPN domain-containing protein